MAAAPLVPLGMLPLLAQGAPWAPNWSVEIAFAIGGVFAVAGWLGTRWDRVASIMITVAGIAGAAYVAPGLGEFPEKAMFLGLCVVGATFYAWRPATRVDAVAGIAPLQVYGAVITSIAASIAWFLVVALGVGAKPWSMVVCALSESIAIAYSLRWILGTAGDARRALFWSMLAGAGLAVGFAGILASASRFGAALTVGVLPAVGVVAFATTRRAATAGASANVFNHHARLLVFTFLALCLAGTILLSLPACATDGHRIPVVDAAFTSVSAVCVTGLIVRDTPNDFSRLGQVIILLLIQVGGLGIMTFATAAIGLLGRRMSLQQERIAATLLSERNRAALFRSLYRTMIMAFGFELLLAPVLAAWFLRYGDGTGEALWRGLFTAVSAFCNAGFALQSQSLIPYRDSGVVLHVVAGLIVLGGLSPIVITRLPSLSRGERADLRTKVIISTTALLLVGGFVLVLALEWGASLHSLSFVDKLNNAWFQSVTARTAGFNSVDFAAVRPPTLTVLMILMFIGGAPGGTAGGIKVTTFFVLALAIVSVLRGRREIAVFGRRIPHSTVYRATAIATLGALVVAAALLAIQITQPLAMGQAFFEVVSALGTVGLTVGGTALLDGVGKIIIIVCMFLGRVGPLTAFLLLYDRHTESSWRLPEEELELG